jgi:glyoxylase-like metal-dependent hydrolase (beta-lactamase superfamily II)
LTEKYLASVCYYGLSAILKKEKSIYLWGVMTLNDLDKGSEILVLAVNFENDDGEEDFIYPVIIADGREKILIDCGYPGFLPKLEQAALTAGAPIEEVTAVIITHQDYDHYGALWELCEKYPNIRVMASELDAPYISGEKKNLRLEQAEIAFKTSRGERKAAAKKIYNKLKAVKPVFVDVKLKDGDAFSWCGGVRIIASPGHTPGHISVYVRRHKTMITGDALVLSDGRLRTANLNYAVDPDEAKASAKKLEAFDIKWFICYHGGVVEVSPSSPGLFNA